MIVSRAPVRLSMGGGGTDLPSYYEKFGGFLMAAAIDKYIYVMVNKRFYDTIRLSYSETEIVDSIHEIRHNIFREALRSTGIESGIELVSIADVPSQCGLGTSSAFTVALLNGLFEYQGKRLTPGELAEAACHIELNVLKEPIGKQDQYAAAHGGFNAYFFEPDGSVIVEPVRIKPDKLEALQKNIFLFHTKMEREAGAILSHQNEKSKQDDEEVLGRLHKIKEMGYETRRVFEKGDIDEFGEILHEHWLIKKGLSSQVSNQFIDETYEVARSNGAIGGKIVGAGGGGFLLLYCPRNHDRLVAAMEKLGLPRFEFSFEPLGVVTFLLDGALKSASRKIGGSRSLGILAGQ